VPLDFMPAFPATARQPTLSFPGEQLLADQTSRAEELPKASLAAEGV